MLLKIIKGLCLPCFIFSAYGDWSVDNRYLSEPEIAEMKEKGVFKKIETAPVSPERIKRIRFTYFNFQGVEEQGILDVFDVAAPHVERILHELYDLKFPIKSARPIEKYEGSDEKSMEENNSSCFNSRLITGSKDKYSIHAYGLAIDINPKQNPYLGPDSENTGKAILLPIQSFEYINRVPIKSGMVETIVSIFKKHGFTIWGGNWHIPIDYQHFQVPSELAKKLSSSSYAEGVKLFNKHLEEAKDMIE